MGLPTDFSLALKLAANYPNVYLDTAFIFGNPGFSVREEWIKAIDDYPTKFIYSSDYPVMDYSPRDALQVLRQLPLSETTKQRLFWDNSLRFLQPVT